MKDLLLIPVQDDEEFDDDMDAGADADEDEVVSDFEPR